MFNWWKQNTSKRKKEFPGEGIVSEEIRPHRKGRVYFRGTWWFAKCQDNVTLLPDEQVEVLGIDDDISLLVQRQSIYHL